MDYLQKGRSITRVYYIELLSKLRKKIVKKRRGKKQSIILLHLVVPYSVIGRWRSCWLLWFCSVPFWEVKWWINQTITLNSLTAMLFSSQGFAFHLFSLLLSDAGYHMCSGCGFHDQNAYNNFFFFRNSYHYIFIMYSLLLVYAKHTSVRSNLGGIQFLKTSICKSPYFDTIEEKGNT